MKWTNSENNQHMQIQYEWKKSTGNAHKLFTTVS